MSLEQRLHAAIEAKAPSWINFLTELIRVPSPTGNEIKAQELVRQAMLDLGVFHAAIPAANRPPFHPTGREYADRPNITGRIAGRGGPNFILNAHIDTAPVEDPASWMHPPFAAEISGGKLWGRGALDDKAGVAMLLLLAECLIAEQADLPGDIYLQSVIEDEDSGNGTLACTLAGQTAEAAIIIDGTWPARVIDAHLGQVSLAISVPGTPAPACSLERGRNPVKSAFEALRLMEELIAAWNAEGGWEGLEAPHFLNIGAVRSGVWAGAVPERCELLCQIGFAPPRNAETVLKAVDDVLRSAAPGAGLDISVHLGAMCAEPFANRGNTMVRALCSSIARLRPDQSTVQAVAVRGHCDLRHLKNAAGGPAAACLYGPGGGGNPHCRDEFYNLEDFIPVAQNIASAMLEWYGAHD